MTRSIPNTILLIVCVLALVACEGREGDFGRPLEKRLQPVPLVLLDDGRPDPAVLAREQVIFRGNGEEPETLDPHLAQGVPSSHILRDLFEGLTIGENLALAGHDDWRLPNVREVRSTLDYRSGPTNCTVPAFNDPACRIPAMGLDELHQLRRGYASVPARFSII